MLCLNKQLSTKRAKAKQKIMKETKSYKAMMFSEFSMECQDIPEVILEPFIVDGSATMIYASSGLGKSFYSCGLAVAIATGTEFLGYKAPKPLKIKYIDGEMSKYDLFTRIKSAIGDRSSNNEFLTLLDDNLAITNRETSEDEYTKYFDIGSKDDINDITKELIREEVEVVIFDNFSTLALGIEDENSAGSFNVTLELILKLKAVGILPIMIHHSNKTGNAYRGTTKIEAVFSNIIGLHYNKDIDKALGCGFTIKFDKNRNEYNKLTQTRTVQLLSASNKWVDVVSDNDKIADLVEAIKSLECVSQQEVGDRIGVSQSTVARLIQKAITLDKIKDEKVKECFKTAKQIRDGIVNDYDSDDEVNTDF